MKWLQALQRKLPQHKYAINAELLGDEAVCAWTNLGYWDDATSSYAQACQQLAQHLAETVELQSKDRLLDLGCGQGASLKLWLDQYQVKQIEAVELQQQCVNQIRQQLPQIQAIYCQSFLNLNTLPFQHDFDVVLCIDAAYHSHLNAFLSSMDSVLSVNGRLGFHYLMLSDDAFNIKEKLKHQCLLKAADVKISNLMTYVQLEETLISHGYGQIQIQDLSEAVLKGFSQYIQYKQNHHVFSLDQFKIDMTAKLCQSLYQAGIVRYVQVTAQKI